MMTREEFHTEYKKQLSQKFNQTAPDSKIDRAYDGCKKISDFLGLDGDLELSDYDGEIHALFSPHYPATSTAPAPPEL